MSEFVLEDCGGGRFALSGDMSFQTTDRIMRASDGQFGQHASLEIDLSRVERADSAGLALLLEWKAQARQRNATIRFQALPKSLLAIARASEVDGLI